MPPSIHEIFSNVILFLKLEASEEQYKFTVNSYRDTLLAVNN